MNSKIQDKKSKTEGKLAEEDGWEDEGTDIEMDNTESAQVLDPIAITPRPTVSEGALASTEPIGEEEDVIL